MSVTPTSFKNSWRFRPTVCIKTALDMSGAPQRAGSAAPHLGFPIRFLVHRNYPSKTWTNSILNHLTHPKTNKIGPNWDNPWLRFFTFRAAKRAILWPPGMPKRRGPKRPKKRPMVTAPQESSRSAPKGGALYRASVFSSWCHWSSSWTSGS